MYQNLVTASFLQFTLCIMLMNMRIFNIRRSSSYNSTLLILRIYALGMHKLCATCIFLYSNHADKSEQSSVKIHYRKEVCNKENGITDTFAMLQGARDSNCCSNTRTRMYGTVRNDYLKEIAESDWRKIKKEITLN